MNKPWVTRPEPSFPLPPDAKKVFSGHIFSVYQWQQEMYDGSYHTFESLKRPDTVVVIPITPEGKILITEEEQPGKHPFISFPGGRSEEGEDPVAAAIREFKEETGFEADRYELWNAFQPYSKIDWAIFTFIAKGIRKVAEPVLDAGEKIAIRTVSFDELVEIVQDERFQEINVSLAILKALQDPAKLSALREQFQA